MVSFSIEIIITVVMFFVGVIAGVEMNRAAQRTVLEWRTTGRHSTTPQERRRSLLVLVVSSLLGMFVLPHFPSHYIALVLLPFASGLAFTIFVSTIQKFIPPR